MKSLIVSLLLLFCVLTQSFAQQGLITCRMVANSDRTVSINVESLAYGDYTVKISFQNLQGYRGMYFW